LLGVAGEKVNRSQAILEVHHYKKGMSCRLSFGHAGKLEILEPIRKLLESDESDVIPCWALDSLESARCGSLNTA
jgi:hypothetical protein